MGRRVFAGLLALGAILAACSNQAPRQASTVLVLQNLPNTVQVVTLEVDGQPQPVSQQGENWVATLNLSRGKHTFVARGWDAPEGIVLYKAHEVREVIPGQEVRLRLFRITSDVEVVVANPQPGERYVALASGVSGALPGGRGVLQGIPTGRGIPLVVEARDSSGYLLRQGGATLNLSESPISVTVQLEAVSYEAPRLRLTGSTEVVKGEVYTLRVEAQDPNPADRGVTLHSLVLDWGDGVQETFALSGKSLDQTYPHVYTSTGTMRVTVQVTNSKGVAVQEGLTITVRESPTSVVMVPGPDLSQVEIRVQQVPAGTDSVWAEIVPDTPLVPQSVKPLDLRNRYHLALFPENEVWRGSLFLPQGQTYRLELEANQGGTAVRSQPTTFSTDTSSVHLEVPFVSQEGASCPAPSAPLKATFEVQGEGFRSPLEGSTVAVRGVVTAVFPGLKGFYLQDPQGDGRDETSDGLFVYQGSLPVTVLPGQFVQVVGRVTEYAASTDTLGTLTQVVLSDTANLTICGSAALPEPVTLSLPVDDWERYEGMFVRVENLTVTEVSNLGRYGEITLASQRLVHPNADGDPSTHLDPTRPVDASRILVLDDASTRQNPDPIPYLPPSGTLRVGDRLVRAKGVIEWRFGAYRLQPVESVVFSSENPRPAPPAATPHLRLVSFNLYNWFTTPSGSFSPPGCAVSHKPRGATSPEELDRQRRKLVAALKALDADVVAVQEVQNNGSEALEALVEALNSEMGAQTYSYVRDPSGGLGCDAIKVGFLYKPSRVEPVGDAMALSDPVFERFPLAQVFRDKATGGSFVAVNVHLKSKGGCDPSDPDTGQGCWNSRRTAQAQALANWIEETLREMDRDVVLLGDFNAYEEEDPLALLRARGLVPVLQGHYTYVYMGLTGALDHAYATPTLTSQVKGSFVWHINADEPRVLDYTLAFKTADPYDPTPYRSSDHDPLVLHLDLTAEAPTGETGCSREGAPVVINEFRLRGPAGGNDEFIELFNRSCTPIQLGGWKVQGLSSTGTWGDRVTLADVTLEPGQYYLLANTSTNGYSLQVPPDQNYSTGIADNRALRLVNDKNQVVDLVGFASSGQYEGTPLPDGPTSGVTTQISWKRVPSGKDTDNNSADFRFGDNWANPQNRASPRYAEN